jgi:hypothetical protein
MSDKCSLPEDSEARNGFPMFDGLVGYFPNALAAVSEVSRLGNEQHNPGQPMHWARDKSTDHLNKVIRHAVDAGKKDSKGIRHSAYLAWRALANLQEEIEREGSVPVARNARYDGKPKSMFRAPHGFEGNNIFESPSKFKTLHNILSDHTYSKYRSDPCSVSFPEDSAVSSHPMMAETLRDEYQKSDGKGV